ncbi:hypothetical protein GQ600_6394 [Phytophthora cactorum]|nr:hypothetical protein GQ600_6394 [Phytophthora cactorum]
MNSACKHQSLFPFSFSRPRQQYQPEQMRPRFEEGEELVFVTDIVQLERIVADENCTSGASTSSAGQAPATPAPTRSQRQSKRQIDRLRREITTLNVELARLHLDETGSQTLPRCGRPLP